MGETMSTEERQRSYDMYANTFFSSSQWRGFGIDDSLQRFSGFDSTAALNTYRDQVLYGGDSFIHAGSTVQRLGSALGGLSVVPNAVGLGALVVALILENVGRAMNKQTMGTAQMLQRVFAQEKSTEVLDLMDEYLKRLEINLGNPQLQLADTRRIEESLSVQLTRLKNSMLKDGHMNTEFLRRWTNGAAFHTQMLIHQARLEGSEGSKALQAADVYQRQLNLLLDKYRSFLRNNVYVQLQSVPGVMVYNPTCCLYYRENALYDPWGHISPLSCGTNQKLGCGFDIASVILSKPQITWAETYFSDLKAKIPALVYQRDSFHVM